MPLTELQRIAGSGFTAMYGEKTLTFHPLTLTDVCDFEDNFGSLEEVFLPKHKTKRLKAMRALLWHMLKHTDPDLTEAQAGNYFEVADMSPGGPLEELINSTLPEPDPKAAGAPGPAKRPGAS